MQVVILAGGKGTRIKELSKIVPKPMIKILNKPLLLHIMNHYIRYGFKDFIIAAGYKKEVIQKYFNSLKLKNNSFFYKIDKKKCKLRIVDTGKHTLTGGRLKRVKKYLDIGNDFMFTYGDGVSNVNLKRLITDHKKKKKLITVTAVRPPARFGEIVIKDNLVKSFKEKPQVQRGWINGGFFAAKFEFLNFIKNDQEILEKRPLEKACKKKQLNAFKHTGFWKCMDTMRDREVLIKIFKNKIYGKR